MVRVSDQDSICFYDGSLKYFSLLITRNNKCFSQQSIFHSFCQLCGLKTGEMCPEMHVINGTKYPVALLINFNITSGEKYRQ